MRDVAERAAILVIADINGYTKFMLSHRKSLGHSQMIISDLLNSGVKSADTVLEVAKLEGDAVFLFAFKKDGEMSWDATGSDISAWTTRVFDEFNRNAA